MQRLRTKLLSVRITPEQWERLKAVATAEQCRSPSEYTRKVLGLSTTTLFDHSGRPSPKTGKPGKSTHRRFAAYPKAGRPRQGLRRRHPIKRSRRRPGKSK